MSSTKKLRAGGECDAWCTKCRLDLGHRIIAMVGDTVKKVECMTCGSHHMYRKPMSERNAPKPAAARTASGKPAAPRTHAERITAAERAERERVASWERSIAGQPTGAFKAYRTSLVLGPGELVRHPKFGDGVVARVIDRQKVEILFKDGSRTMAHGMS